ncbi:hypothetical protein BRC81_04315 [Halobacteriales archaeon QS_1_68_20]|nr:MAG: hypothetical protein BRC81_04315 [Halobacteriales archaeon QS_1_68_20]
MAEFGDGDYLEVGTAAWVGTDGIAGRVAITRADGGWLWTDDLASSASNVLSVAPAEEGVAVFGSYDEGCSPNDADWFRSATRDGLSGRHGCSDDFTDVVVHTSDGGYVFAYVDGADRPGLREVGADGEPRWERTDDVHEHGFSPEDVVETDDGGLAAVGPYYRTDGREEQATLLLKTNASGDREWLVRLDPAGREGDGRGLAPAGQGRLLVAGRTTDVPGTTDDRDWSAWTAMVDESADAHLEPETPTATPTPPPPRTPPDPTPRTRRPPPLRRSPSPRPGSGPSAAWPA